MQPFSWNDENQSLDLYNTLTFLLLQAEKIWLNLYTLPLFLFFMKQIAPSLTVDGLLIKENFILLIQRKHEPFQGHWALPGGFVEYGERTEDAVVREVFEETGLEVKVRMLLGVYSDPTRDPRGHTVTIVYLVDQIGGNLTAGDDADSVKFFNMNKLPALAFDHALIVKDAFERFSHGVLSKM